MIKEKEYTLSNVIEIADGGEMIQVDTIKLKGPTFKDAAAASGLKRLIHQSLSRNASDEQPKAQTKETDSSDNEKKHISEILKPSDIVNTLASSALDGNTIVEAYGYFKSLCTSGCCEINGKNARSGDITKIDLDDWNEMLGVYVSNFLLNSLNKQ